jgi:hypothetical protein
VKSYLNGKVEAVSLENRNSRPWDFVALTMRHPLSANIGTNFADMRRSLGRYSQLADLKPRSLVSSVFISICLNINIT